MSGGNEIIITSNSLYSEEQCLEFNEGTCVHRITYYPEQTISNYKTTMAETNSNVVSYAAVIIVFIRLIKGLFRLILPSKGKK